MGIYLHHWSSKEDVILDFFSEWGPYVYAEELEGCNILLASYSTESYEGYAFVLYEKDGTLYEVNGSHCSCYGLDGQWEPEETSLEALRFRMENGNLGVDSYYGSRFQKELKEVLENYER